MNARTLLRHVGVALLLASVPASAWLVATRLRTESDVQRVTIVMDAEAVALQARATYRDPFDLALLYRSRGLTGIAIYEDTPESLAAKGAVAVLRGADAVAIALAAGEPPPAVPGDVTLVTELVPGATRWMVAKAAQPPGSVDVAGRTWWVFPGDVAGTLPSGPDLPLIGRYVDAGFEVAYRPRNAPGMRTVMDDLPLDVRYVVHAGLDVAGHPSQLDATIERSQGVLTAAIEGTVQSGFATIARRVPTVRLLSFNQDYVDRRLDPSDLVDKYLLAAEERNVRVLYLRPYTTEERGPMIARTERLVEELVEALTAARFDIAALPVRDDANLLDEPPPWLRAWAALGVIAGVLLLALAYPGAWGWWVAAGMSGLGVAAAGLDWNALALTAAVTFPVLGLAWVGRSWHAVASATAVSLVGAMTLVAVGSDPSSVTGLEPFRGVAATLVVPPAAYLALVMVRARSVRSWLQWAWVQPIRLGPAALVVVGVAALALVVMRRGNVPLIGASEFELALRSWLSQEFARPRFKELLGHPMTVIGAAAAARGWPVWIVGPLLTGGVIAQASILNSFSHYHTPLPVSLERTVVAWVLGTLLGAVGAWASWTVVRLVRGWTARRRA